MKEIVVQYLTCFSFNLSSFSSWTNKLITAKDHAAVQINVGKVDPATGRYTGKYDTYALCGFIRDKVCL